MSFVCFYVDNSNIFHEGQRFARQNRREDSSAFRLYFKNFVQLAIQGRDLREVVWGGSVPPPEDSVWGYLRDEQGIEPDLLQRSEAGEQETVDHLLQLRMHRHARKFRNAPGTIVLATGDGKGYQHEDGFLYDVEGFVEDGWGIELLSWEHSCHGELRKLAEEQGKFVPLDNYYDQVTFIKGGRIVRPLR